MNSTRCPIQGCTRRKGRENLCCTYHWLIIINDITYAHRHLPRVSAPPREENPQSAIRNPQ